MRRDVRERRFVEQRRIHDAVLGEMLDHQIDEVNLIRSENLTREKISEHSLGRRTIETDERADE